MPKVKLTDANTRKEVVLQPQHVICIMRWYHPGAKPEDKPAGTLLVIPGIEKGLLVEESYEYCRGEITAFWEQDDA